MCKIPIQLLFRSLIATFIVCGAGHVHASWEFDESVVGLDPGSSYRLAFVTSQTRDAAPEMKLAKPRSLPITACPAPLDY